MRKDIKKSSYYVWFLGAQESKGLRGAEYVVPVVKSLVQRERDVEPFKVTLQVSHKGLKIIQNIPPAAAVGAAGGKSVKNAKPEVVKHFIPHHAVTCVLQDDDIVACILLLYNPVTKCPVHVHAYRCDSVETAEILRGQLQTLIERPDNQKKLNEIEARLARQRVAGGAGAGARRRAAGPDGRSTSTREVRVVGRLVIGAAEAAVGQQDAHRRPVRLAGGRAAEKLGAAGGGGGGGAGSGRGEKTRGPAHAPILLPPRDYDTVHRQKGNLTAIDLRRCLNANIVGVNVKNTAAAAAGGSGARGSSGGSSGIGSDHAPSPDQQDVDADGRFLDHQSSSGEEEEEEEEEGEGEGKREEDGGGGEGKTLVLRRTLVSRCP
ncbi:Uncharacterized protein GBIM_13135 [Gryllus bimaculatus]|nr:Uncharacterized protein GBIM_13135 [Gryllus bimaculatus]